MRTRSLVIPALLLTVALVSPWGCHSTKSARRYSKAEAAKALAKLEKVGLVIGDFPVAGASAVIDGDTIRVTGLQSSLRLLAIDTEETFKYDWERQAFAAGWDEYVKKMRGDSERPSKMATPLGEEAKKWAEAFFEGVTQVRLERDHPGEIRDYYGRYLSYVLVRRNGEWLNYNLECVRAGMSPYYTKYGRSRRFDQEFEQAQRQAREAQLGIWRPGAHAYPDYPERLAWWSKRAEIITRFEREMVEDPTLVALTRWDAVLQLEQRLGKPVVVLGSVNEVRLGDRGPTVVKLARNRSNNFDVVFFDKDVFLASGIAASRGEYVRVRGVVQKYLDKTRNVERLQIQVTLPGQILSQSADLDALLADDAEAEAGEQLRFSGPAPDHEPD
jgi:endonuclease YncB( thermonuclease family)